MLHALAEPWTQAFLRRALLELALVGVATGPLGCWVVFYELSYSAESLARSCRTRRCCSSTSRSRGSTA